MDNKYLEVVYDLESKPQSNYPKKLAKYLVNKYKISEGQKFLELGCGRGDFINEFHDLNLETYTIDSNDYYKNNLKTKNFFKIDITKTKLPFEDNFFDVIYSKSFIEHFYVVKTKYIYCKSYIWN